METYIKYFILIIPVIFFIIYIFENKNIIKINVKRVLVVFISLAIIIIIGLLSMITNGKCSVSSDNNMPFSDIPQIQCKIECYCDGLNISDKCIGKWRNVCKNE